MEPESKMLSPFVFPAGLLYPCSLISSWRRSSWRRSSWRCLHPSWEGMRKDCLHGTHFAVFIFPDLLKQTSPSVPLPCFIFVRTLLTSKLSCLYSESINYELVSSEIKGRIHSSIHGNPTARSTAHCNAPLSLIQHRKSRFYVTNCLTGTQEGSIKIPLSRWRNRLRWRNFTDGVAWAPTASVCGRAGV